MKVKDSAEKAAEEDFGWRFVFYSRPIFLSHQQLDLALLLSLLLLLSHLVILLI